MLEFSNHSVPLEDTSAASWGSSTGSRLH